jgi:hypothetical protein
MGPWVVRQAVGRLHRHTRLVDAERLSILWNQERIRLDSTMVEVGASPVRA